MREHLGHEKAGSRLESRLFSLLRMLKWADELSARCNPLDIERLSPPVSRILSGPIGRRRAGSDEIVIYLGPPSPAASSGLPAPTFGGPPYPQKRSGAVWPCTTWGLPSRAGRPDALVGSYSTLSPITCAPEGHRLVCSLLHLPSPSLDGAFPLGSTLPCGVRTFLPGL